MKRLLILIAAVLLMILFTGCSQKITILYSSSLNGNLSGCNCSGYPVAGLVKRVAYLKNNNFDDAILLDAGNLMEAGPDPLLSGSILGFYDELGYDAIAVGNQDFAEGIDALREYADEYPFISDNLYIRTETGSVPFRDSYVKLERNGLRIGVLSILDIDVFRLYPDKFMNRIEIADPEETVMRLINEGRGDIDVWIVLFHGYRDNAVRLATDEPRIAAVIFGHEEMLSEQELRNGVLLLSPGEEGNRLGSLELRVKNGKPVSWKNDFKLFHYIDSPDDPEALAVAENYTNQLRARIKSRNQN